MVAAATGIAGSVLAKVATVAKSECADAAFHIRVEQLKVCDPRTQFCGTQFTINEQGEIERNGSARFFAQWLLFSLKVGMPCRRGSK